MLHTMYCFSSCESPIQHHFPIKEYITNAITISVAVIYLTTILQDHLHLLASKTMCKFPSVSYFFIPYFFPHLLQTFCFSFPTGALFPVIHLQRVARKFIHVRTYLFFFLYIYYD